MGQWEWIIILVIVFAIGLWELRSVRRASRNDKLARPPRGDGPA